MAWDSALRNLNPDIRYLLTRLPTQSEWHGDARYVAFVLQQFGEATLLEALRRVDRTTAVSKAYFWGICRNVAKDCS